MRVRHRCLRILVQTCRCARGNEATQRVRGYLSPAALRGQSCQPLCQRRRWEQFKKDWAGIADALPVIHARLPEFAERCRDVLEHGGDNASSLRAAAEARELL